MLLSDAIKTLLSGVSLSWSKSENYKAGSIQLSTPGARRLFEFLLASDPLKVAEANEGLFDGLLTAWRDTALDPAKASIEKVVAAGTSTWRLVRLEACGFGGLNSLVGPEFSLQINSENWCLEGQNGSGKTSIASAIIWALTGYRCRDQEGLVLDDGSRQAVFNDKSEKIGEWPALVSYPSTAEKLKGTAEAWVRLTFQDNTGSTAIAYRKLSAPPSGNVTIEAKIDPALQVAPQLIETGLLMPARLSRIGFGEKSQSIYEAVKRLTGLDQLGLIGDGSANFTHKAKRFLKYAQDNGIGAIEATLKLNLERAEEEAKKADFKYSFKRKREDSEYAEELKEIAQDASKQAGEHLATLKSDIASGLDTEKPDDRAKIKSAVTAARGLLQQGTVGIKVFEAWTALAQAAKDERLAKIPAAVVIAKKQLTTAISWHQRQTDDSKLRLKALASEFFVVPDHEHTDAHCPLCESALNNAKGKVLADELAELKQSSAEAERRLSDVCAELEKGLRDQLPKELLNYFDLLVGMKLPDAFASAALDRFVNSPPFSTVLTGMAAFARDKAKLLTKTLPAFSPHSPQTDVSIPKIADDLLNYIRSLEHLISFVDWWKTNRTDFCDAWASLRGIDDGSGQFPLDSLEGKLSSLETALEKAAPLDDIAKALTSASVEAAKWHVIYLKQQERENIAAALDPLKDLRTVVTIETANSISALSARMKAVLDRIHFRERLSFSDAALGKKAVHIAGCFHDGILIDASTVANTSWLRAILWAFVIALREETLENLGSNPFPLVVLDDPQVTFDPRNKRKWAEEIAKLANAEWSDPQAAQLILTTHERQFFQFLVNLENLKGQQGLIVSLNAISNVTTIVNGTSLAQSFSEASKNNDDKLAHAYILEVRTYCEDLLRIMLRSEGPDINNCHLGDLATKMRSLATSGVSPFNRQPFEKLLNVIAGTSDVKTLKIINDTHHHYDGTVGLAEAKDVKKFWEKALQAQMHTCFRVFAEYEAYCGEPRVFPWMDNVVEFPKGNSADVKKMSIEYTGIAAAAKTDGRVGDGLITLEDLASAEKIVLYNHDIFQLAAGTLEPIASVGHLLIVSNNAKLNQRNLVTATCGDQLLARRYNEADVHPHIAVLTGQSIDPYTLPQPIIVPKEKFVAKKIVGTLFPRPGSAIPPKVEGVEFVELADVSLANDILNNAKLFKVSGRSAEPIALDGQFIITQPVELQKQQAASRDGMLVIAVDENGARYFKRLRVHGDLFVLESLNPDGTTAGEILSSNGQMGFPKLTGLLDVVGVLFEHS